jgi:predicted transcriptional regulator
MNLEAIVQALHLKVRSGQEKLAVEVRGGYVGDLLSDVMANSREGDLWITRQVHQNIVAVASLRDLAGIVLVRGSEPAEDTLEKAIKEKIPILVSDLATFETAGMVYRLIGSGEGGPA